MDDATRSGPRPTPPSADCPTPPSTPPAIEVDGAVKRYGDVVALAGVSLSVGPGEIVALLGPSGCGKSTLLAGIAGLTGLDSGTVSLGGRLVHGPGVDVAAQHRRIGLVFQDHALFPHLDVAANVGFGLRHLDRPARRARVGAMLDLVRLAHLADRYPHELSGGESQRVALARSLAPSPAAVLLDEPFASLDPALRGDLRIEVGELLRIAGLAAVVVTHDPLDALTLAERIVVLRAGRVAQGGTAAELLDRPADAFVVGLFGPAATVPADVDGSTALGSITPDRVVTWSDERVAVLRPHELTLEPADESCGQGRPGTVRAAHPTATGGRVVVEWEEPLLGQRQVVVDEGRRRDWRRGEAVRVRIGVPVGT